MSDPTPTPSPVRLLAARLSNRADLRRSPRGRAAERGAHSRVRASRALLRPLFRLAPALAFVLACVFAAQAQAAPKYEANFASFAKANGYFAIKGYHFDNGGATVGTSGRGSTPFSAVTIERAVDFRSSAMLSHYVRGELIPTVTVRFGEGTNTVFSMELKRVVIVGVSQTVSNPNKKPTELVTLRFEEIRWTARTPDGKTVKGSWKAKGGK